MIDKTSTISKELIEALFGITETFEGQNPVRKIDDKYFMKVDEIRINRNGVKFVFKNIPVIEYHVSNGDVDTVTFTGITALLEFDIKG